MVICLEQGADLHIAQLMPLPLAVSCSSKIQISFTFLVPAYPGCPGKEAVKWLLLLLSYDFHITPTLASLLHESGDSAELGVEQGCDPLPNLFGRLLT